MSEEELQKSVDKLTAALMRAAVDAFNHEVLSVGAEPDTVGADKQYPSRQAWIDARVEAWLKETEMAAVQPEDQHGTPASASV